jgi:hypothetical protein
LILVEALDEAVTAEEPNIVTLLAGSADLPTCVRFVLTSRNEPRVIDQFDGIARLDLSAAANNAMTRADLTTYVARRLPNQQRLGKQTGASSDLVTKIVDRAEGNFLYAAWLLNEFRTGEIPLVDPMTLPKGLYGLYRAFLDRLVKTRSPFSEAWLGQHEPFFGSLTVAVPAAPEAVLPLWLGWSKSKLNAHVHDVAQVIEYLTDVADGEAGYRLFHRSVAEFLAAERYPDNGGFRINEYYVEPARQHDRIASYYLTRVTDTEKGTVDWSRADRYGLSHLVGHLVARLDFDEGGPRPLVDALYNVSLDAGFQAAQLQRLGSIHDTLADLRTTLDVALRMPVGQDLVQAFRTITAHRALTQVESLSRAVFTAVSAENFALALLKAEHYSTATSPARGWDQILTLYIAWEAAESGKVEEALEAIRNIDLLAPPATAPLLEALLTRVSLLLARVARQPADWLADFGRDQSAIGLLDTYGMGTRTDTVEVLGIVRRVEPRIWELERHTEEGSWKAVSAHEFIDEQPSDLIDPETSAELAWSLERELYRIADQPAGQGLIQRAVLALTQNPYPRYRDIALAAVGTAVLGSSERHWVRKYLQKVLRAGLDDEGVTFTFDLPAVVLAEVQRRGGSAPQLEQYLDQARNRHDVWGTSMRALSAQAAAAFRSGSGGVEDAFSLLITASAEPTTYAGYGVLATLALIDRCHEWGEPERADLRVWGPSGDRSLPEIAIDLAQRVYDPVFRQERLRLVEMHRAWSDEPAGDPASQSARVAATANSDERIAYLTHLSARWAAPWEGSSGLAKVKALVPLVLFDSTALDAVLGRLLGMAAPQLDVGQLDQVAELVSSHLTTGRPWSFGQWR